MPLLEVEGLHARYGYAPVVQGVSFSADAGEIVSIFGRNGAGKTTTLRTIMGLWQASSGQLRFDGRDITKCATPEISQAGIAYVPENMGIFADLTAQQQTLFGTYNDSYNKTRDSRYTPEEGFNRLTVSEQSTFYGITHALANTSMTDASGTSLGSALDRIESIERIAGQYAGRALARNRSVSDQRGLHGQRSFLLCDLCAMG